MIRYCAFKCWNCEKKRNYRRRTRSSADQLSCRPWQDKSNFLVSAMSLNLNLLWRLFRKKGCWKAFSFPQQHLKRYKVFHQNVSMPWTCRQNESINLYFMYTLFWCGYSLDMKMDLKGSKEVAWKRQSLLRERRYSHNPSTKTRRGNYRGQTLWLHHFQPQGLLQFYGE